MAKTKTESGLLLLNSIESEMVFLSEHIVHTAILEDCFSLATFSDEIIPDFRDLMTRYRDFGRLGCITVSGDRFTFRLLEECKTVWKGRKPEDKIEQKLAFVLGWVSHRAADRQMKPIWTEPKALGKGTDADPRLSPTDCSVYHEGFTFREYYSGNNNFRYALFQDELEKLGISEKVKINEVFSLVQPLILKNLFELQTLEKESENIHDWFEKIALRMQHFYVDINRYVRSAMTPDPEKLNEYVNDINFFDREDLIVKTVIKVRNGGTIGSDEIKRANGEEPKSHYGKALKMAYNYVKAASDYYSSDMSIDELKERLDIGKRGRDGNVV